MVGNVREPHIEEGLVPRPLADGDVERVLEVDGDKNEPPGVDFRADALDVLHGVVFEVGIELKVGFYLVVVHPRVHVLQSLQGVVELVGDELSADEVLGLLHGLERLVEVRVARHAVVVAVEGKLALLPLKDGDDTRNILQTHGLVVRVAAGASMGRGEERRGAGNGC